MAVTYGFYDSLNHDRLYNAKQMSAIFDGIINDGVFDSVGNQLHTVAGSGMQVIVKSGRAWFNSTWTLNDAEYPLTIDAADVLLTRIDAVVIEVNSEQATRANSIKVVKGTPASSPAKPTLTNTSTVHQHALAYVTIAKNTTAITNSMIEIVVGKTETPYVTAILQTTDITDLYKNWEDQFTVWFETVKGTLDGDVALNLQNQIDHCVKKADKATTADIEAGTADKWVDSEISKKISIPIGTLITTNGIDIQDNSYLKCIGQHLLHSDYPSITNYTYNITGPIKEIRVDNSSSVYLVVQNLLSFLDYNKIVYIYYYSNNSNTYRIYVKDIKNEQENTYTFSASTYPFIRADYTSYKYSHYIYFLSYNKTTYRFDILTGNMTSVISSHTYSIGNNRIASRIINDASGSFYVVTFSDGGIRDTIYNSSSNSSSNIYVTKYNLENNTITEINNPNNITSEKYFIGTYVYGKTFVNDGNMYFESLYKISNNSSRNEVYKLNLDSGILSRIDNVTGLGALEQAIVDVFSNNKNYVTIGCSNDNTRYLLGTYTSTNFSIDNERSNYIKELVISNGKLSLEESRSLGTNNYCVHGYYDNDNSLYILSMLYASSDNYIYNFSPYKLYKTESISLISNLNLPYNNDYGETFYSTFDSTHFVYVGLNYRSYIYALNFKDYITLPSKNFTYMKIK